MGHFPFIVEHMPLKPLVAEQATQHRAAMIKDGVKPFVVIACGVGVPDSLRATLTVMRLLDLKSTYTYKRFSLHEATEIALGKNPLYKSNTGVHTENLVIDMTGRESGNRKAEEFTITLMELAIKEGSTVTFTVSAAEERWAQIRKFTVDKGFQQYSVTAPDYVVPDKPAQTASAVVSLNNRVIATSNAPLYLTDNIRP